MKLKFIILSTLIILGFGNTLKDRPVSPNTNRNHDYHPGTVSPTTNPNPPPPQPNIRINTEELLRSTRGPFTEPDPFSRINSNTNSDPSTTDPDPSTIDPRDTIRTDNFIRNFPRGGTVNPTTNPQ
jgi:hypothetical protein